MDRNVSLNFHYYLYNCTGPQIQVHLAVGKYASSALEYTSIKGTIVLEVPEYLLTGLLQHQYRSIPMMNSNLEIPHVSQGFQNRGDR